MALKFRSFIVLIASLLLYISAASAQSTTSPVSYSVFLIGDCGEPFVSDSPIGKVLREKVQSAGPNATVLYLGDNIYPRGLPEEGEPYRETAEKVLQIQVDWIKGLEARGIFVPGNHDWDKGGKAGLERMLNQQQWLDSLHDKNFTLLPKEGCPGPIEVPLNNQAVLVILDTQWFLHPWDKPDAEGPCEAKSSAEVFNLLIDVFNRNPGKRVIVAGHHPLMSYGYHGGVFTFKDHIFPLTEVNSKLYVPLPVLGSIVVLYRKWFGNIQDVSHPNYRAFSSMIRKIMAENPGSIFVAGHEHNLQYIVKDSVNMIVSGSGSKYTPIKKTGKARFAQDVTGFVQLSVHEDNSATIHFYQVDGFAPRGKEIFTQHLGPTGALAQSVKEEPAPDWSGKTVRVKASEQYHAGRGKKIWLGANYRAEWAQEIEVPVFDIGTERGGLKIVQRGGGQQTLSLRYQDSTGHEFVTRSVEKYPEAAVPEMLRNTFAQDLVQDQISASHPYAALVVPAIAEAAGIYHTNPKLVYIPDDKRFGEYRKLFANSLALFEERPADNWNESSFFGNSKKIINTSKVLERLANDNDNAVDQEFVLKSRLFDLVIGDWDRHDDQWRWATLPGKKGGDIYHPIPRDRDQAFFVNEGKLSKMWSRKWVLPKFEGFDEEIDWPSGLSFNARYFDRSFLTEPSLDQWIAAAKKLQKDLTDEVIEKAIRQWPEAIFKLHGERIIKHLKARRDALDVYAVSHYEFLAREVNVVGSDKRERFEVKRQKDGDTEVEVFKITKEGEKGRKLYDRVFKASETKEVRLYGLRGDDDFIVTGASADAIKVRVIGGDGHDRLFDSARTEGSSRKVIFYDQKGQGQYVSQHGLVKDRTSEDASVNEYDRKAFQYNRLAPLIFANFNPDDGPFVGGGFVSISHGFRKKPFKQRHLFLASVAPVTLSFNFQYQARFTEAVGKWNVDIDLSMKAPNFVNNFFGWGNESIYNQHIGDEPDIDVKRPFHYYRYRFEEWRFEPSLWRKIRNYGSFRIGPAVQRIEVEEPDEADDRFIETFASTLPYNLFNEYYTFAGVSWQFAVDQRDHAQFTRRGIVFNLAGRNMAGLDGRAGDFSSYETSLSLYHSFRQHSRVVFAARTGFGLNTGTYDFYQAQVLDGKTELRGFRKTRFYGDRKFYSNFELRLRLLNFRSYLFPASMGILGFHDLGRVWYKDDAGIDPSAADGSSGVWHKTVGGGIWFTPFNAAVLSTEVGHSNEGNLVYVRLGFLF